MNRICLFIQQTFCTISSVLVFSNYYSNQVRYYSISFRYTLPCLSPHNDKKAFCFTEYDLKNRVSTSSTSLGIGDITVPIPDVIFHPERVAWTTPGNLFPPASAYDLSAAYCRLLHDYSIDSTPKNSANYQTSHVSGHFLIEEQQRNQKNSGSINMFFSFKDPLTRAYLRWMLQKEILGQDMCLVGEPGPALRWLVLMYSNLLHREVHIVFLNRDTSESDLKQRREMKNGNLLYEDQSAVLAAKEGHLLILEGLEKLERNVLPVINNLLENREMHLDNGQMLIHPERYDLIWREAVQNSMKQFKVTPGSFLSKNIDQAMDLPTSSLISTYGESKNKNVEIQNNNQTNIEIKNFLKTGDIYMEKLGFIRVSEKFRVIGVTVPVPPFQGNPLDPPLRSRFQCLYVQTPLLSNIASSLEYTLSQSIKGNYSNPNSISSHDGGSRAKKAMEGLIKFRAAIEEINHSIRDFNQTDSTTKRDGNEGTTLFTNRMYLQPIGNYEIGFAGRLFSLFPDIPLGDALATAFPWRIYAIQTHNTSTISTAQRRDSEKKIDRYYKLLEKCGLSDSIFDNDLISDGKKSKEGNSFSNNLFSSSNDQQDKATPATRATESSVVSRAKLAFSSMMNSTTDSLSAVRSFIHSSRLVGTRRIDTSLSMSEVAPQAEIENDPEFQETEKKMNYLKRIENIRFIYLDADPESSASCKSSLFTEAYSQDNGYLMGEAVIASKSYPSGEFRLPMYLGNHLSREAKLDTHLLRSCPLQEGMVLTIEHYHILQTMLQLHVAQKHILLIGPAGCGKTALIKEFSQLIGYPSEIMHLYVDMTNRDIFQRRTTVPGSSDTVWENSRLVRAAINGELLILDGIDKLPQSILSSLQQLLVDQSTTLFDGTVLKPLIEYEILKGKIIHNKIDGSYRRATDAEMRERKIFPVHPAFRVIATARPPAGFRGSTASFSASMGKTFTLSQDVTTLFGVINIPEFSASTLSSIFLEISRLERTNALIDHLKENIDSNEEDFTASEKRTVGKLILLKNELELLRNTDPKIPQLSFRQMKRLICHQVRYPTDFPQAVEAALLIPLMHDLGASQVLDAMRKCGILPNFQSFRHEKTRPFSDHGIFQNSNSAFPGESGRPRLVERTCMEVDSRDGLPLKSRSFDVNGVTMLTLSRQYDKKEMALVPYVPTFSPNPIHDKIIVWLAKEYALKSNILIIGNQGVGKNKVVDAFLSLIGVPRHYIQLHRDTTVGSLTINPTVEKGSVIWEDSPLVKAVQLGHCLVADEIDKAPVEVIQVLKGLIEDREMLLGDGRCIVEKKNSAQEADKNLIFIHPDFRIIVLANPPGFPFHGNDFFRECGDLFSAFVMDNPDLSSQLLVLKSYTGSCVPDKILEHLVLAFDQLQKAYKEGTITYPFSLRELIAVVKHLSIFPQDGIYQALNNVFSFDTQTPATLQYVQQVLHRHLQPLFNAGGIKCLLPLRIGTSYPLRPLPEMVELPLRACESDSPLILLTYRLFSMSLFHLATRVLRATGKEHLQKTRVWRKRYSEFTFSDDRFCDSEDKAFTEWDNPHILHFLKNDHDHVLAMTSLSIKESSTNDTEDFFTPNRLFSVLIRREEPLSNGMPHAEKYILATISLPISGYRPPNPFSRNDANWEWPPGYVGFIDLTPFFPQSWRCVTGKDWPKFSLESFDLLPHTHSFEYDTNALKKFIWPPSMRMAHRRGTSEGVPLLALTCHSSTLLTRDDLLLLIDVQAVSESGWLASNTAQIPSLEEFCPIDDSESMSDFVLPVRIGDNFTPPDAYAWKDDSGNVDYRLHQIHRETGTMMFSVRKVFTEKDDSIQSDRKSDVKVGLWLKGFIIYISLPSDVVGVHSANFCKHNLISLALYRKPKSHSASSNLDSPDLAYGILRIPKDESECRSSSPFNSSNTAFLWLPKEVSGHLVYSPMDRNELLSSPQQKIRSSDPCFSEETTDDDSIPWNELCGAVYVPHVSRISVKKTEKDGARKADFYRIHKVDLSKKVILMKGFQLTQFHYNDGRCEAPFNLIVNHAQNQLVTEQFDDGEVRITVVDLTDEKAKELSPPYKPLQSKKHLLPSTNPDRPLLACNAESGLVYCYNNMSRKIYIGDLDEVRVRRRYEKLNSIFSGNVSDLGSFTSSGENTIQYQHHSLPSHNHKTPSGQLKHGEVDDKEHHGGNTFAGGTGGTDTAGLGGLVGPYRLNKGYPIYQVSEEEKKKVPPNIVAEAKQMGKEALKEKLTEIGMGETEYAQYKELQSRVRPSIEQLRSVLLGLKAAEGERIWVKNQAEGIWDDNKLVEGILGERKIYKRRMDSKESNPFQSKYKKRLLFVLDVSASMYRFEMADQRLTKLIESTIMVMEAFSGLEQKIDYSMIGHNGDSECIPLVDFGHPPCNQKERMIVCQKMIAYSQYCWSGDNTVEAMRKSLSLVTAERGDAYFVFVISDANLQRYGITHNELSSIINSNQDVNMFCIFIASLGSQALSLQERLPTGKGFVCQQTHCLPHILKQIFTSVNLV